MHDLKSAKELFLKEFSELKMIKNSNRYEKINQLIARAADIGFYEAPASTKYHLNIEGGLLIHSVNVFENLRKIIYDFDGPHPVYSDETIFLVAMFHDIHKCTDLYNNPQYIEQTDTWRRNKLKENYTWNNDQFAFNSEFKSVLFINNYVPMTAHELQAVAYHSGMFKENFKEVIYNLYPLTLYLHMADMLSAYIQEVDKKPFDNVPPVY